MTGGTIGDNIENARVLKTDVIRPLDQPYDEEGGLAILFGSLAPDGAVVKKAAVDPRMMVHEGPARVFDGEEGAIEAILGGKIKSGDVVVIRYEGPRGGPGMRDALSDFSHCRDGVRPGGRSLDRRSFLRRQ